jgi:UDP-2,3-diacylglucosamine hydrolase
VIPKVDLKVLFQLRRLVEAGVQIIYLAGNHDIWLGKYLENEIGITIHHGPLTAEHNSLKIYIAHGHGLAKRDRFVRFLNRLFKNRLNIFLYRLIHPDWGIPFAHFITNLSRGKGDNPYEADYREFARAKWGEGYDVVILGHSHIPVFEKVGEKYYINLGDWIEHFTYLELSSTQPELKPWLKIPTKEFTGPKLLHNSKGLISQKLK